MARFWGEVQGSRGEAGRAGGAPSGMRATAKSWNGDVDVRLYASGEDDFARIRVSEHESTNNTFCLFEGNVRQLLSPEGRRKWITQMVMNDTGVMPEVANAILEKLYGGKA